MRRSLLVTFSVLAATAAHAEGFAVRDLSRVSASAAAALGGDFAQRAEARRLTLTCPSCKGEPMVDVALGRQADGTEQRIRSGETSIARLEALCQAKSPECRISALDVAPAIGWISAYPLGSSAGSTAVILRDGDLLTIRSLASDPAVARRNAMTIVKTVAPQIIGR